LIEKERFMTPEKPQTVITVYSRRGKAEAAVDELWHAGFRKDQIGFLFPGKGWRQATTGTEELEEDAAEGAVLGSITGGTLGGALGAAATAAIPGVGPVIAGGLLTGVLGGAAAGAALGAFAGPFVALGLPEDEARLYESDFRAGRTIVVVQTEDRRDQALVILRSHGPLHVSDH
jgi:hypothetical protein